MSESQRTGQRLLMGGLAAIIAVSVITILISIFAGNFAISSIIRLLLTTVLCYYCYKGNKPAKIILVILCIIASIVAVVGGIGIAFLLSQLGSVGIISLVQLIIMSVVYVTNIYLILGSKKVKDYMEYCKESSKSS